MDIQLFTDAAPSIGFGGFYQGRWFKFTWPAQLLDSPQSLTSSALFELYPLEEAAFLWGKEWSSNSIIVHCNNEASVHCINKAAQISPAVMPLLRCLIWIAACDQFFITAKHVPGSRFAFQKFRLLAPDTDPFPTSVPHFRADIHINHPLKPLLDASLNSILQAVSPSTLQSYLTAWKLYKSFHFPYNLPFPNFSARHHFIHILSQQHQELQCSSSWTSIMCN